MRCKHLRDAGVTVSLTTRPTVQERLQQTLAQWPHWRCPLPLTGRPEVEGPLHQGHSNPSFLVSCGQRFVVRLDGMDTRLNSINRQAEWHILNAAHRSGLAPQPCYFNPDLGSLVCSYLPQDAPAPLDLAATAGLLRRIHALPAVHQRLHLAERIGRYARRLSREHAEWLAVAGNALPRLLQLTARDHSPAVLCHNDLLRANRLSSGGRLYALDWEYAAMGQPLYDIAVLVHGDELPAQTARALLEHYLGRPPEYAELTLLTHYGCLYRYLELLWHLVNAPEHNAQSSDNAKDPRLAGTPHDEAFDPADKFARLQTLLHSTQL